jgi:two-component system, response regulator PdtaR
VEDEVLIRLMIVDDLTAAGFAVVQASTADEALKLLRSVTDIALVVTDVRMPGTMNGLELARRVRADWPKAKIALLSGNHEPVLPEHTADAFVGKPYWPPHLIGCVNKLLGIADEP